MLADVSTAGHVVNVTGFGDDAFLPLERLALLLPAALAVGQIVPDDAQDGVVVPIDPCFMPLKPLRLRMIAAVAP